MKEKKIQKNDLNQKKLLRNVETADLRACRTEGSELTSQRLFHDEIHGDGFLSPRLPYLSSVTFTGG